MPDLAFRIGPTAVVAAAAIAAGLLGTTWSHAVAPLPWLVALVAVGLPHGAADLVVTRRMCPPARLARVWIAYLAIMVATATAFAAVPAAVVGAFVVLAAWHFGLPRGGIAIGVPLVVWPGASGALGDRLLELTGCGAGVPAFSHGAVESVGIGMVAVDVATALMNVARATPATRARDAYDLGELAALAVLGVVADPLFAVGCGFLACHAWRQMEPLAAVITGAVPRTGRGLAAAVIAIHLAAIPLLVPTWLAIGSGWWLMSVRHTATDLAILSIAAYLILTPAHEMLAAVLRSGILGESAGMPRLPRVAHPSSAARCVETCASSSG